MKFEFNFFAPELFGEKWYLYLRAPTSRPYMKPEEKVALKDFLLPLRHQEDYWLLNTVLVARDEDCAMEIWMKVA